MAQCNASQETTNWSLPTASSSYTPLVTSSLAVKKPVVKMRRAPSLPVKAVAREQEQQDLQAPQQLPSPRSMQRPQSAFSMSLQQELQPHQQMNSTRVQRPQSIGVSTRTSPSTSGTSGSLRSTTTWQQEGRRTGTASSASASPIMKPKILPGTGNWSPTSGSASRTVIHRPWQMPAPSTTSVVHLAAQSPLGMKAATATSLVAAVAP